MVTGIPIPPSGYVPPPLGFSQVLILKAVKVLCFDTLLHVLILNKLVRDEYRTIRRLEIGPMTLRSQNCLGSGQVPDLCAWARAITRPFGS